MAKVIGPAHSDDAHGKLASSLVYGTWKGRKYVRGYVIPANPQTADQGDQRLVFGGTGKAVGKVQVNSAFHTALITLGVIPNDQSKQSYLVKRIIDVYMNDITAYEAMVTEFEAHSADSDFASEASDAGFADFSLAYAGSSEDYVAGLQLYMLAKIGFFLGVTDEPFDTALASWTVTEIAEFVALLVAV